MKFLKRANSPDFAETDILDLADAGPGHHIIDANAQFEAMKEAGTATDSEWENLRSTVSPSRYNPHAGKPSLVAGLAKKYNNVRKWFDNRKVADKTPASEVIIEHKAPKAPLTERIAHLRGKAAEAVTSKVGQATDWTKFAAYKSVAKTYDATYGVAKGIAGFGATISAAPGAVAKGLTGGHSVSDTVAYSTNSTRETASRLLSGVSEKISNMRADAAYHSYVRNNPEEVDAEVETRKSLFSRAKNISSGLLNRVKSVGQSLKDPATVAQAASCAGIGILTKTLATKVIGVSLVAGGSAALAATGAVAIAGGAGLAYLNGHLRSEFAKVKENKIGPMPEDNRSWIRKTGSELFSFAKFSGKYMASGQVIENMRNEWKENKKDVLIRTGLGAVFGGIGFGVAAHEEIGKAFHGLFTPTDMPSVSPSELPITDADTIPLAPAETVQAPAHVMTLQEAQVLKDQAVHEYWHGDKTKGLEMFRQAAENGNTQAVRDYFELTGEHVQFTHIPVGADQLDTSSASTPVVHAAPDIKPSLKLDLTNVPLETTSIAPAGESLTTAASDTAATLTKDKLEDAAKVIGGGAVAIGAGALASTYGSQAGIALSLATTQPQEKVSQPAIAQACQISEVPEDPDLYKLSCPSTPFIKTMNEGNAINGIELWRKADGRTTKQMIYLPASSAPMPTKYFECTLANDTLRMGEALQTLRGLPTDRFRNAAQALAANPTAKMEYEARIVRECLPALAQN